MVHDGGQKYAKAVSWSVKSIEKKKKTGRLDNRTETLSNITISTIRLILLETNPFKIIQGNKISWVT